MHGHSQQTCGDAVVDMPEVVAISVCTPGMLIDINCDVIVCYNVQTFVLVGRIHYSTVLQPK